MDDARAIELVAQYRDVTAELEQLVRKRRRLSELRDEIRDELAGHVVPGKSAKLGSGRDRCEVSRAISIEPPRRTIDTKAFAGLRNELVLTPWWASMSTIDRDRLQCAWKTRRSMEPGLRELLERHAIRIERVRIRL
jgi:hypothetical protein